MVLWYCTSWNVYYYVLRACCMWSIKFVYQNEVLSHTSLQRPFELFWVFLSLYKKLRNGVHEGQRRGLYDSIITGVYGSVGEGRRWDIDWWVRRSGWTGHEITLMEVIEPEKKHRIQKQSSKLEKSLSYLLQIVSEHHKVRKVMQRYLLFHLPVRKNSIGSRLLNIF